LQEVGEGVSGPLGLFLAAIFIAAFAAVLLRIAWGALWLIRGALRGLKEGRVGRYDRDAEPVTFWGLVLGWPLVSGVVIWGLGSMAWTIVHAAISN
jgi:hypothetical protein